MMVKKYLMLLVAGACCGLNLGAMQGQLISGSKKVLNATCKVAKTSYAYALPVTIGGVVSLAAIYKTIPASRGPIRSATCWLGNKCYNAYSAVCYEVKVRPILDDNNRREGLLRDAQQQNARDGEDILRLTGCFGRTTETNRQLTHDLQSIKVSSAMIHQMTGQVALVAGFLEDFGRRAREGLGEFNIQLGTAVSCMERLKVSGKGMSECLSAPMPLSFEEKALAVCSFAATNQALDDCDAQFKVALVSLKDMQQGSELSNLQLQEITDQLPELMKILGFEPAE